MPESDGFPMGLPAHVRWRRWRAFGSTSVLNTALDHAGLAVIVYLALVLTESLWRRLRHAPGIGMGDAKALFALCTLDPMGGIVAFAVALLALALSCLFTKSRSLPLLPFLVPIFAIIEVVGCTL